MIIDIEKCSYAGRWFEYQEGVKLQIRIYPASLARQTMKDGAIVIEGEDLCKIFKHCLVGWEGVDDAKGKPVACTNELKQKIYDFDVEPAMVTFVLQKARELRGEMEADQKNS